MATLPSVELPAQQWVQVDTPVQWVSGNSYRLQPGTSSPANLFIGAAPDDADALVYASGKTITVPYDGTAVWMRSTQFDGEVSIEDIGATNTGGGGSGGGPALTNYALETTQQQVLQAIQNLGATQPAQIMLTASANAQTVYTLPFQPVDATNSRLEYNGITYRLTGGDYTIGGSTLTLTNPVVAPNAGNAFTLITA